MEWEKKENVFEAEITINKAENIIKGSGRN